MFVAIATKKRNLLYVSDFQNCFLALHCMFFFLFPFVAFVKGFKKTYLILKEAIFQNWTKSMNREKNYVACLYFFFLINVRFLGSLLKEL